MSKIAQQIFENAKYEQEKYPTLNINVGYGFKRNKHNLNEVKELAKAEIRQQQRYARYGIATNEEANAIIKIMEQLQISCEKTIEYLI